MKFYGLRKVFALPVLLVALSWLAPANAADPATEITWEDLLPKSLFALEKKAFKLQARLHQLNAQERQLYMDVRKELAVQDAVNSGQRKLAELSPTEEIDYEGGLSATSPEAVSFWKRYESLRLEMEAQDNVLREDLSGKKVRLPGYLLPLEFEGTSVREFLLVPYIGACIHTPPPPPNQMVFVKLTKAYAANGLFEPVWVEGAIKAEHGTHGLFLVDGRSDVDVGYELDGLKVEPYK